MKNTLIVGIAVLDGMAVGGLTAILLVYQLLQTIMDRLNTATAQGELLNVLDHLLPYVLAYAAATVVMEIVTVMVGLALGMSGLRKPDSPMKGSVG